MTETPTLPSGAQLALEFLREECERIDCHFDTCHMRHVSTEQDDIGQTVYKVACNERYLEGYYDETDGFHPDYRPAICEFERYLDEFGNTVG